MMQKKYKILIQMGLAIGLILFGIGGCRVMRASRMAMQTLEISHTDPMARVITVEAENILVPIEGFGTVKPTKQIKLVPQVAGKIVSVSPRLVDGGIFTKGDVLAVVEPADYTIAVTLSKARVQDAESRYMLQAQEAVVARSEWKELHPDTPIPPLVAKEPQLKTALANLEAVRAELEKAQLNLSRTQLVAPFDGRVSEKNVDAGQYVTIGQSLAVLYATDTAEISVPLESKHLFWLDVPGFTTSQSKGSDVEITARVSGIDMTRTGKVVRAEGRMDERTRMISVVVQVDKPYDHYPPLAFGLFAKVRIKGKPVENGMIIPRSALHQEDVVWVVNENGRLEFRTVDVAVRLNEGIVISSGLSRGEKVVVSTIKDVTDGMKVRDVPADHGGPRL